MSTAASPAPSAPRTAGRRFALPVAVAPAMTRCECSGLEFAEIARRVEMPGGSLEAVMASTGCASTCTACTGDLMAFLAARSRG